MLFSPSKLVDGRDITILNPGRLNSDAGPDFFNSRIRIGDTEWAGNIEIHVKASDWHRHGHSADKAYDNVVLHVVAVDDARIRREDGSEIPQLLISAPMEILEAYDMLSSPEHKHPCRNFTATLSPLQKEEWIAGLGMERLQEKAGRILDTLDILNGDWEQTCFAAVARALGFGLNGSPLEILARNIPLKIIAHHADNPVQTEALLFGQAGMLDSSQRILDEYYQLLCREYFFLVRKYSIRPPGIGASWKYSRTRPANFPHRRIALLASMAASSSGLMSRILDAGTDIDELDSIFSVELSPYWQSHFSFDTESEWSPAALSRSSLQSIYINAVAPLHYAFGLRHGDWHRADMGVDLLNSLPAERNVIIRSWKELGVNCSTAFDSQALIHLHKQYCLENKCTDCRWGQRVFRSRLQEMRR